MKTSLLIVIFNHIWFIVRVSAISLVVGLENRKALVLDTWGGGK